MLLGVLRAHRPEGVDVALGLEVPGLAVPAVGPLACPVGSAGRDAGRLLLGLPVEVPGPRGELTSPAPVPAGDRPGGVLRDGVRGAALVGRLPQQVRGHLGPAALRPEAHLHHR